MLESELKTAVLVMSGYSGEKSKTEVGVIMKVETVDVTTAWIQKLPSAWDRYVVVVECDQEKDYIGPDTVEERSSLMQLLIM